MIAPPSTRSLPPGAHPLRDGLPEPWAVEWGRDRFGVFTAFAVGDVVQRLRWVPAGTFAMGSPGDEEGRWGDEGPQHYVELTQGYWLAEAPCTQALWVAVMGEKPSRFKGDLLPVDSVSWEDCQRFLGRLDSFIPGLGARLPTEAEWERACRAGTEEPRYGALDEVAWYGANSGSQTHPAATKAPNDLGLYDMLGNAWEWCEDWFGPYTAGPATDPRGPEAGSHRVLRGGSWCDDARSVRAACRYMSVPANRFDFAGLRLARGHQPGRGPEVPPPEAAPAGKRSRRP